MYRFSSQEFTKDSTILLEFSELRGQGVISDVLFNISLVVTKLRVTTLPINRAGKYMILKHYTLHYNIAGNFQGKSFARWLFVCRETFVRHTKSSQLERSQNTFHREFKLNSLVRASNIKSFLCQIFPVTKHSDLVI